MATSKTKWIKLAAYVFVVIVVVIGIGDSLWWQDLVAMFTRPEGLMVYVR